MLPLHLAVAAALMGACAPIPPPHERPASVDALALLEAAPDLDGTPLGGGGGRETIAVVFASWCVRCRAELGTISQLLDRPDLRVVGINFRWQEEYDDRGDMSAVRR